MTVNKKMDVIFLWKQNDSGIYGRRADMLLKELAQCEWVDRIIEFDSPIDIDVLEQYENSIAEKDHTHYSLIYNNAFKGYLGQKEIYGVKAYTYIYRKRGSNRKDFRMMDSYFDYVKKVLSENGIGQINNILLWNCPINYNLSDWIKFVKPNYIISDIIDDQRAWSNNERNIKEMTDNYNLSIEQSNLLLVNCKEMYERICSLNQNAKPKIRLISNGCEHFDNTKYDKPPLLRKLRGPIIGQVSNLEKKIDIQLLEKCAISHPEWNIILIGSIHANEGIKVLENYPNIYMTGPIPYEEVKKYISNFDVAIIAHRIVEINKAMNPLKLYVYCSLGANVVSTNIPGIDDLRTLIRIGDTHEHFIAQIEEALKNPHIYTEEDIKIVNQYSWKHKLSCIEHILFDTSHSLSCKNTSLHITEKNPKSDMHFSWKELIYSLPVMKWGYKKWEKINNEIKKSNANINNISKKLDLKAKQTESEIKKLEQQNKSYGLRIRNAEDNMDFSERRISELEGQIYNLNLRIDTLCKYLKSNDTNRLSLGLPKVTIILNNTEISEANLPIINKLIQYTAEISADFYLIIDEKTFNLVNYRLDQYPHIIKKGKECVAEIVNGIAEKTHNSFLVYLNGLLDISSNWLERMYFVYSHCTRPGIVGMKAYVNGTESRYKSVRNFGKIQFQGKMLMNIYSLTLDYSNSIYEEIAGENIVESAAVFGTGFLIDKKVFLEIGGLNSCFSQGFECVDLSLKLYHHGYHNYIVTDVFSLWEQNKNLIERNYNMFRCRWQSYLAREILKEKLQGSHQLSKEKLGIGIICGQADENDSLELFGQNCLQRSYSLKYIRPNESGVYSIGVGIDLLVSVNEAIVPENIKDRKNELYLLCWVKSDISFNINAAVYSKYDMVYFEKNSAFYEIQNGIPMFIQRDVSLIDKIVDYIKRDISQNDLDAKSIDILGGMPNDARKYNWGDYHYALSLKREFEKCGYKAVVKCYPEWFQKSNSKYVLVLRGVHEYCPKIEGQTVIMWNISHPAEVTTEEYNACDLVYIASERLTKQVSEKIMVPVKPLLQCTDEQVMTYSDSSSLKYELLFIGNSRGVFRKIIRDLLPTEHKLTVYGRAWDKYIPSKYIAGTYYDNAKIGQAYHDAAIVLNDHWDDMKEMGIISNRLFDALAAEGFVISDDIPEIKEVFDGAVVTYSNREDLKNKIDFYLKHPDERRQLALHGQIIVLNNHTFEKRVKQILVDIEQLEKHK